MIDRITDDEYKQIRDAANDVFGPHVTDTGELHLPFVCHLVAGVRSAPLTRLGACSPARAASSRPTPEVFPVRESSPSCTVGGAEARTSTKPSCSEAIAAATRASIAAQLGAGIDIGNDGEQARESFFTYVQHRMTGFGETSQRPLMRDLADHPDFLEMAAARYVRHEGEPDGRAGGDRTDHLSRHERARR